MTLKGGSKDGEVWGVDKDGSYKIIDGKKYHRVFVTWEKLEPQAKYDHWFVWINTETGLIEQAEFTAREYETVVTFPLGRSGAYSLSDYRDVEGLNVPHSIIALYGLGEDEVHRYTIKSLDLIFKANGGGDEPTSQPIASAQPVQAARPTAAAAPVESAKPVEAAKPTTGDVAPK